MMYHGKLYGKLWNKYFDTEKTSEDFDKMESRIKELEAENEKLKLVNGVDLKNGKALHKHCVMPRKLTAENGAKSLLIGEFAECFDPEDCGNPYVVPISWDSIKRIYDKIVSHYGA